MSLFPIIIMAVSKTVYSVYPPKSTKYSRKNFKHVVLNLVSSTRDSELHLTGIHYPEAGTKLLALCGPKEGCYLSLK